LSTWKLTVKKLPGRHKVMFSDRNKVRLVLYLAEN